LTPVLDALASVTKDASSRIDAYPLEEQVPVDDIVNGPWSGTVLERDADGVQRVNRFAYEVCALLAPRQRLHSDEHFTVDGALPQASASLNKKRRNPQPGFSASCYRIFTVV
jgi:hypothetical protein